MPSAAKRRKAANKKKEKKKKKTAAAVISNGSCDGGENSSPASLDIETDREPSLSVIENVNADENETVKPYVNHGGLNKSSNRSLSIERVNHGSLVDKVELFKPEMEDSKPVVAAPVVWFESNAVVLDSVIHDSESVLVPKLLPSSMAEMKLKNCDQKVHPSETFPDFKTDSPLSDTNSEQPCKEIVTKQSPPQSFIPIDNGECRVVNSEIHQCPEKEPLLQKAIRPASKTSWTNCCGLFELFTGSSS